MNNVVSFILEQKNKNLDIDELREIGEDYFFDGNFLKAFYYLYKAAQKDCFYSMSFIGYIYIQYYKQNNFNKRRMKEALKWLKKAYFHPERFNYSSDIIANNIAEAYYTLDEYEEALKWLKKAIKFGIPKEKLYQNVLKWYIQENSNESKIIQLY